VVVLTLNYKPNLIEYKKRRRAKRAPTILNEVNIFNGGLKSENKEYKS
jgi:hypothetical protein